jgi:hypothetical protein
MGVSSQAPPLPVLKTTGKTRPRLIRLVASPAFGCWWLDPIAGLGIAGLAVHEGREAWAGSVCGDCAQVGFDSATVNTQGCDCE